MHEVSLMQTAIDIAVATALENGATRIQRLTLRVGALSGVITEALTFAFDAVAQGTIAESAELNIEIMPGICYCSRCNQEFPVSTWIYECPLCHQICSEVRQGQALEIASLEVT